MPQKTIIHPSQLPKPTVPLSSAVRAGDFVFVAGTVAKNNPATGALDPDIRGQVRSVLETIRMILEEAGTSLGNVVSVMVHLTDRSHFAEFNDEYGKSFPVDPPSRTTVQAELMRPGLLVEITCIAVVPS